MIGWAFELLDMDIEIEGGRLQKRLMVDKRKLIVRQDLH
jgi:hypothetical protein